MLRLVPNELREGSLALGATRSQTVMRVCIPTALPGIITGAMLAVARASFEQGCGELGVECRFSTSDDLGYARLRIGIGRVSLPELTCVLDLARIGMRHRDLRRRSGSRLCCQESDSRVTNCRP